MTYAFTLTDIIPAEPRTIYDTWLDSRGHTAMTGGKAKMSNKLGADVSAWDGYIFGKNVVLEPGKRIVQTWRTTRFTEADPDSKITVTLVAVDDGTELTLHHAGVPDEHKGYENGGWQTHYFDPMKKYFGEAKHAKQKSAKRRPKRKPAKAEAKKARTIKKRAKAKKRKSAKRRRR
ncbi:MAG TPA: SRPBCC domain-containing protein [Xanthobacteraceae bacterium]|nr:SRPBCC domain-containing protein [Xanthobacteraceae bacterium]